MRMSRNDVVKLFSKVQTAIDAEFEVDFDIIYAMACSKPKLKQIVDEVNDPRLLCSHPLYFVLQDKVFLSLFAQY